MTELQKQVQRAQWRINSQRFLSACVWALAICLGIAAIGIAIPKIWHVDVDAQQWRIAWLAGSVLLGVVLALGWTWWHRNSMVEAAMEIDRRYGLKERVSSSLALSQDEVESEIGRALVDDASNRVQRIDVSEKFQISANRWAFLPFLTGGMAIALVFLPDANLNTSAEATAKTVEVKKVKKSTTALQKKLSKKSEELEKNKLPEASKLAKKLEQGIEELSKQSTDKKQTMVKMNDLAKMLRAQRDSMKGSEDLQKKLNQMKGMKVKEGPADKLAKAMQNGDFQEALKQIGDLRQRMRQGTLSPKQQELLTQQMQQMQQRLDEIVKQHEQQKEALQKQLEEAQRQGNKAAARKLRQKLEQLKAQDQAMKRLQQMANQMQQMSQNMQNGNQQQAAQQLDQLAQDLEMLQQEMAELKALDDLMDQLASAKDSMNCDQCDGGGCPNCQGFGGFSQSDIPGMGLGEGQGQGDRPEEKTDSRFYDSKVAADVRKGKMVITGNVRGPNKPGEALEAIKAAMDATTTAEENPLTNVKLPKAQLEQAQQYFDSVRAGTE